jgi:hypothetical protein
MANDDYYTRLAKEQWQQLTAERAQILANLETAKANSDDYSARASVQELADVEAKRASLVQLHEQYRASQQAPQAPELSQEERNAKTWDKMDYSDVWEIANTSRHGVDPDAFRAGIAYVAARKARGE